MAETVRAIYEKGVLRPLGPLHLEEQQIVRIQVEPEGPVGDESSAGAAIRALVAAGRLTPPRGRSAVPPLSEEERRALADRLGARPGKPLSEIVIEERGEW